MDISKGKRSPSSGALPLQFFGPNPMLIDRTHSPFQLVGPFAEVTWTCDGAEQRATFQGSAQGRARALSEVVERVDDAIAAATR